MPLLTAELIFYAVVSGLGLFTAVYAMLNGSVRIKPDPADMVAPPAGFNTPVLGGAALAFGVFGYVFARYGHGSPALNLAAAVVAGGAGWVGMTVLMARWALNGPIVDPHEELEELQGTVATITRPITADALGEIAYTFRGRALTVAARSIDGNPVEVGEEVVIEKIENDVADVELWSVVEQRI